LVFFFQRFWFVVRVAIVICIDAPMQVGPSRLERAHQVVVLHANVAAILDQAIGVTRWPLGATVERKRPSDRRGHGQQRRHSRRTAHLGHC
jgi:hypothetical protein